MRDGMICAACHLPIDPQRLVSMGPADYHADCIVALQTAQILLLQEYRDLYLDMRNHHAIVEHEVIELRAENAALKRAGHGCA